MVMLRLLLGAAPLCFLWMEPAAAANAGVQYTLKIDGASVVLKEHDGEKLAARLDVLCDVAKHLGAEVRSASNGDITSETSPIVLAPQTRMIMTVILAMSTAASSTAASSTAANSTGAMSASATSAAARADWSSLDFQVQVAIPPETLKKRYLVSGGAFRCVDSLTTQ